jgi:hypothetical protein
MSTVICKPTGNDKGNDNDKDKDKAKDNDKDKDRSRSPPARGRRLNIVIRIRDGGIGSRIPNRDFTVSVEASATVDDVKAQIYAEKGLRQNDQMLYLPCLGDRLEDGRTLSSYNIVCRVGFGVNHPIGIARAGSMPSWSCASTHNG